MSVRKGLQNVMEQSALLDLYYILLQIDTIWIMDVFLKKMGGWVWPGQTHLESVMGRSLLTG